MKLSIFTDEFTQNLSDAILFAKEYSLDALELRTIDDLPIERLDERRLLQIAEEVQKEGLIICNLAGSFGKCLFKDRETEKEKLKRLVRAAKVLETPFIRGFGFFSDDTTETKTCAKALIEPIKRLEQEGIMLLLEADPSVTTKNHRQLRIMIEMIDRPNVGAIYDPGNDVWDPMGEIPFPDGWNEIRPYVRHIHIKDARKTKEGPQAVKVGTGEVDFLPLLKTVKESGYQGFLSLETHYRATGELSEEQMKRPGGAQFSIGGYQACRESMEELKKFLKQI